MRGFAIRLWAAALVAGALLTLPVTAAQAASSVSFSATLNGRSTSSLSTNDPLVLRRGSPLTVALTVRNSSTRAVTIAAARVQGRVMGLSFFSFDTQLNLVIAPNSSRSTKFQVGLTGLADQADGLLPTEVALLDRNSDEIVSKDITVDVKGKLTSIYGIFGLAIAAITLLWLVSLLYRVSRRALPANRWQRGVQFSAAGFGVGLALTFSVSALRLLTPSAAVWAPFVLGAGAIGLAVGYITPGPRLVDPDEEADFIAARERQYARISGGSDDRYLDRHGAQPELGTATPQSAVDAGPQHPPALGGEEQGQLPSAAPDSNAEPGRDTTVQASRSDVDSIFGSQFRPDDRDQR
ncbi:hypothetical protein [uncultured Jatrophihabitans sp.]|uniref:hypothetical protein n=1 Tax=uncultured Jatrophihabitans sp. TaxID=1610747 RepID=UPI0035CA63B4